MPAGIIMRGIFSGSRLLPHTNGDRLCVDPRFLCPAAAPQALGDIISGFGRRVRKFFLSLEAKSVRIMDLKYVRSELRKLSEIVEGWNANQEIGSLERDLVLDKLRTLYEAVRFGAEAEPPAADASGQEPFPTEIPVSLDLGEVLSIESLSVAEPELPSLSGSGPEPESGFIAPLAGPWRRPGQISPIAIPRWRKRWPNPCWIPCRRTDKSRPGLLRNLPKSRLNRLRGRLRRLNPRLPGWFPILKPRLRKKFLRPNRLEIAPARKCRLKILRRHPNRMGIPVRRSLPVCRGHPGRKGQPPPGTSPHTGKHPRGCPNRKQLPDQGRKRALPTRLPERGRILRQRRSRSRRPCSASKRRPSATAINSG